MNPSAKGGRGKPAIAKNKRKSREELNTEGRARQRQKKRRGLASGSRAQEGNKAGGRNAQSGIVDRRIGSKKPVPLIADAATVKKPVAPEIYIPTTTAILPEVELENLENDERLDELLQKLEQGKELAAPEQAYVDKTLDRIDELMTLLGIEIEDDEEEDVKNEDMLQLLKRGQKDSF
ncbi:Der GTPase-activating protein YihI [Acerihabitans arboris]|uniref:Der GTPase-activating protein YihI n=1 Tax=Acerihabitans arboris TaxID=2691583 RepID=A0A845SP52_9GAMM|nr:Der GTPase-activating protein YihI [Acerihabitans arboris]NDL64714.1 Der GTPase-activating protein YihI [Acerihabitans arboris]